MVTNRSGCHLMVLRSAVCPHVCTDQPLGEHEEPQHPGDPH